MKPCMDLMIDANYFSARELTRAAPRPCHDLSLARLCPSALRTALCTDPGTGHRHPSLAIPHLPVPPNPAPTHPYIIIPSSASVSNAISVNTNRALRNPGKAQHTPF